MKILSSLTLCLITALCSGCTNVLKSDYRAPEVNYPINWTKGDVDGNTSPFDWEEFNDPNLDNWLHLVMTSNNDIAIAALRIHRAQLDAGHCCKVSDEAAFCLIQRPYISKTLLT
ncbi:hypothetical protein U4Z42_23775, partial [Escherichia coli]|nr:hypothetical protein [Escherichia coli]